MAGDLTRKFSHTVAEIDAAADEVTASHGEYESLAARLTAIEARLAALEPAEEEE